MSRDIEDVQSQIAAALEKCARTESRTAATAARPAPGDLYAFSVTAAEGIEWAVVLRHSDDAALWFIVPYDQNPLVGTWDVATAPDSDAGPGTLRCGHGIWAHVDDLVIGERSGFLEPDDVRAARLRLGVMVGGDESLIPIRPEVDDDPDYEEWMDELSHAAERLEAALRAPASTVSVATFRTDWIDAPGVRIRQPTALAAASSGLAAGPEAPAAPLPGTVVSQGLPGVLVAVREESGVRLLYEPSAAESPPCIRVRHNGSVSDIAWRELPDGTRESVALLDAAVSPTILGPRGLRRVLSL